jgi:integrase
VERPILLPDSGTPAAATMPLWDIKRAAEYLQVSDSWVRRHLSELPHSRHGRLIRFDSDKLKTTIAAGKSLKPESEKLMVSRRYQEGSVMPRKKWWIGMYRVDAENGRKQVKVKLGLRSEMTRNAAKTKLRSIIGGDTAPRSLAPKIAMSFADVVTKWKEVRGPSYKTSTFNNYVNTLRAWVTPELKDDDITAITNDDLQLFLNEQAKVRSRSSVRSMRVVLQHIMSYALKSGLIASDPSKGLTIPQQCVTTGCVERIVYTREQVLAVADRLKEPYRTLWLFLLASGLRISEAVAVKWTDLDGNLLRVRRRVYNRKVDDLKTKKSERLIPIQNAELLESLRSLGEGQEWVFRTRAGTPVIPGNFMKRYLRPACEVAGVNPGGFHDSRHTVNTLVQSLGSRSRVAADILGHTTAKLAENLYDHASVAEMGKALSSVVNQLLPNGNNSTSVQ